ncbi:synaptosomal-associated protein 29-like [Gigantopelta aegis]|uniref:synaptosomal-associated protein 29-like n=1 Tax=Gigantopelta aegis TaxID=1735272 RepID=UPI001B887B58|nr:synaptosomal-associated protein 29-like [Gigantopelta aegis]
MSAFRSANPFEEEEDDDFGFEKVNNTRSASSGENPFEDKRTQILKQVDESESRQLDSTRRALSSIYESESMGTATAEELLRQHETLNNIETKTDQINKTMTVSQKHLNSIKSVFGGIKNWWSSDKNKESEKPSEEKPSALKQTLQTQYQTSPAQRKTVNTSGFYDEEDDLDSKFMASAPRANKSAPRQPMLQRVTNSAQEDEVDENLALMCDGMSRLKGLALGLGDEIEQQNEQLDRINVKATKADSTLDIQNRQMRKILK